MKANEIINCANDYLKSNNILEFDIIDIYKLISYSLGIEINKLYISEFEIDIKEEQINKLNNNLNRYYIDKIPLQYIVQKQVFYKEEYFVNENVLIPRYDSEVLVEKAIEYIEKNSFKNMLDMCCGSGCLGISIAKNSSIENVILVDISSVALEVTNKNIMKNKVQDKCKAINSDLFSNLSDDNKFDLIVSNPPYIKTEEVLKLDEYVKKEPCLALDGGEDGIKFYKKILDDATSYLKDNSYIIFEIGYDQLADMKKLISNYNNYDIIECIKDYSGNDRVVVCRFHQK